MCLQFLKTWIWPPRASDDPRCSSELQWYEKYKPTETGQGAFVLDYARHKYDELAESYDKLDDKAATLMQTAGVIASALMGAVGVLKFSALSAAPSFVLLLLVMALSLIARHPIRRAAPTTARYILDGIAETPAAEEWVAASLHRTTEEFRVTYNWKGSMVFWAGWLLTAAVAFLILLPCFGVQSSAAGACP